MFVRLLAWILILLKSISATIQYQLEQVFQRLQLVFVEWKLPAIHPLQELQSFFSSCKDSFFRDNFIVSQVYADCNKM